MRVLSDLDSVSELIGPSVLTVGNFDGVHLGHQAILRETVRVARAIRRPAVVLTFEPHPQKIFKGKQAPPLLCTLSQKISLFGTLGIEATIVCPFDENIYRYTADEFFSEVLVVRLGVVHVVEGEDFTFGKGRTGSPERLTKLGRDHGMGVTIVDPVILEGEAISSSRIRAAIQKGDVAKARLLLGRPYEVAARKVSGKGRGRTLGYPTVNLASENELLPEMGVYAVQSECDGRVYQGAASLGFNPTFEGDRLSFEVYLLDFDGSVRDDQVRVRFHRRLRDEIRFDRRQDLIDQIAADVAQVKTVFLTEER